MGAPGRTSRGVRGSGVPAPRFLSTGNESRTARLYSRAIVSSFALPALVARLACLSVLAVATSAQTSKEASVGLFPFLVGNMDTQINTVVNDAFTNDLDILYVSVFRTTGLRQGDLWITDTAGNWNTAMGAVRPGGAGINLKNLITAAHARNLQVVAVLKCFESTAPPSDVSHRNYVLDVARYLVSNFDANGNPVYDLDGIALDYVRWVGGGTGIDPTHVTNFCRDMKAVCGTLSLHAYLLAGRYDFDGPTYDGNFKSYANVISVLANGYGQHWEQMARHVDVLMPMAYTSDGNIYNTYALHQAYVRTTAAYAKQAAVLAGFPLRRIAPAIKTYNSTGETTTPQTIEASITGALQGGNGYQAFRWGTLVGQPTWWAKLKQYAAPGQNRPLPVFSHRAFGLTAALDASQSRDPDGVAGSLGVRYDLGNDGSFETGWLSQTQAYQWLMSRPGMTGVVGIEVRDVDGLTGSSHRRAQVIGSTVLTTHVPSISASQGGSVNINLDAGAGAAGLGYIVLGGLTGSSPGTLLAPGFTVPVNFDGITSAMISLINTPVFVNAAATLDGNGVGRATFTMPPGILAPILLQTFTWAAIGLTQDSQPRFVTNSWPLVVTF